MDKVLNTNAQSRFMRKFVLIFIITLIIMPLVTTSVGGRSVSINYNGSNEITVRGHNPIWLNYTLRNLFNRSLDVEVLVSYSQDYKVKYIPEQAFRMGPHEIKNISVVILPRHDLERVEIDLTVKFSIYEVDQVSPIESKEEHITILIINSSWVIKPIIDWTGSSSNWIMQIIITILFWLFIGLVVVYGIVPLVWKIVEKTKTRIDDIIWGIIRFPIIILLFIYGFVASAELLPINAYYLSLINKAYNILLILVITYLVYKIFNDIMVYEGQKLAKKTKSELDDVLIPIVEKIGDIIIVISGGLWVLSALGIDVTLFLAGLGGAAFIIGLAAQDALANFFAGMHILLDRPFSVGDYIKLEGINTVYRIDKVGVRSTRAYDVFNHEMVIIPNKMLAGDKIINMMKPDEMGKVKFSVGVAYGSDVDKVSRIIEETVNSHPDIIKSEDKKPLVRLVGFGNSSLDFLIIAWIPDIMEQWRVAHELRVALYKKFNEEGIEIPFPQLDVHIKEHISRSSQSALSHK